MTKSVKNELRPMDRTREQLAQAAEAASIYLDEDEGFKALVARYQSQLKRLR